MGLSGTGARRRRWEALPRRGRPCRAARGGTAVQARSARGEQLTRARGGSLRSTPAGWCAPGPARRRSSAASRPAWTATAGAGAAGPISEQSSSLRPANQEEQRGRGGLGGGAAGRRVPAGLPGAPLCRGAHAPTGTAPLFCQMHSWSMSRAHCTVSTWPLAKGAGTVMGACRRRGRWRGGWAVGCSRSCACRQHAAHPAACGGHILRRALRQRPAPGAAATSPGFHPAGRGLAGRGRLPGSSRRWRSWRPGRRWWRWRSPP